MRIIRAVPLVAIALVAIGPRPASALGFYLTGAIGETSADTRLGESFQRVIDGDDDSWAAGVGVQLGSYFAFQLEYHDLGSAGGFASACPPGSEACLAPTFLAEADTTALSLTFLPYLQLTRRISVFAKLGVVTRDTRVSVLIDQAERLVDDFDDEALLYGLGLRAKLIGPLGGFLQYQRFGSDFDEVALGATLGFD